jgi:hypothetical protein
VAKRRLLLRLLDYVGHIEAIHGLVTADFITRLIWPTVATVLGAASGWVGGVPIMWIMVGSSLIFMAITQSLLRADEYKERKNPAHKLQVLRTLFNFELVPIVGPNRKQRRHSEKEGTAPAIPAFRHLIKGQLGFEVWNRAAFPLSILVFAAETEIEGIKPPRTTYPKKAVTIEPGTSVWVTDAAIDFEKMVCDNLDGVMDIIVKYGLPGKERFEIRQHGTVEIFMEPYGQLKGVYFHPNPTELDTGIIT